MNLEIGMGTAEGRNHPRSGRGGEWRGQSGEESGLSDGPYLSFRIDY